MKRLLLLLSFIPMVAVADQKVQWAEIESILAKREGWRIIDGKGAEKAVFDAVKAYSPEGISAYWHWGVRDAIQLPADVPSVGIQNDVIWIGQLNDMLHGLSKSQPRAIFLINARTGEVLTNAKPPEKE